MLITLINKILIYFFMLTISFNTINLLITLINKILINYFFLFLQCEFLICLILTLLGYIPGIIYAIYAIVVRGHDQDEEWRPLTA